MIKPNLIVAWTTDLFEIFFHCLKISCKIVMRSIISKVDGHHRSPSEQGAEQRKREIQRSIQDE